MAVVLAVLERALRDFLSPSFFCYAAAVVLAHAGLISHKVLVNPLF